MLGNFSFGDYFKRDAIKYAFTLLTEVYKLPAGRLVFTVYENDDEAYDNWVSNLGIDPKRVARMGPDTNFWQMADTGPCGPTSEIHWDKQPELGEDDIIPMLQAEDDRFLEIWNLVFMQFNRQQADPDHTGQWDIPLPAPGVDTGMGFERIVSILQDVAANYETDLFMPIIERTQELTGQSDSQRDANIVPYRVIADHIRAAVFLISDGVLPGAKGRAAIPRIVIVGRPASAAPSASIAPSWPILPIPSSILWANISANCLSRRTASSGPSHWKRNASIERWIAD